MSNITTDSIIIRNLSTGPLLANCYIVACAKTRQAGIIDPGGNPEKILAVLEEEDLQPVAIIDTHGHFDHIGANYAIKEATGAPLMIHPDDVFMLEQLPELAAQWGFRSLPSPAPDRLLNDGETIEIGNLSLQVIHTPGHSPGSVCLYNAENKALFSGDTLFSRSIGRTDLPGGDFNTIIDSIKTKLFDLPDDTIVYNGHTPDTSIGEEKAHNPFCGQS